MVKCKQCKYYKPTTGLCIFRKELTTENNFCGGFSRDSVRGILATLSEDEFAACLEVVEKMRTEKKRVADIEEAKTKIYKEINESLDKIGIKEKKKIIRQINRELRDMPIEE